MASQLPICEAEVVVHSTAQPSPHTYSETNIS
jgi:hypothetical protein